MSVIRRPDVLGRRSQRRVDGLTSALSVSTVEAFSVGTWFALVAVEARTAFTALAGLGVLMFGALLRTGFFESAVGARTALNHARRLTAAATFAACWLCWLLVAEAVGGWLGLFVGGAVLALLLAVQFAVERRTVRLHPSSHPFAVFSIPGPATIAILPAILVAIGATTLLGIAWFANWSVLSIFVPVGPWSLVIEVQSFAFGFLAFGCCSFLAQQRRIRRLLVG